MSTLLLAFWFNTNRLEKKKTTTNKTRVYSQVVPYYVILKMTVDIIFYLYLPYKAGKRLKKINTR